VRRRSFERAGAKARSQVKMKSGHFSSVKVNFDLFFEVIYPCKRHILSQTLHFQRLQTTIKTRSRQVAVVQLQRRTRQLSATASDGPLFSLLAGLRIEPPFDSL